MRYAAVSFINLAILGAGIAIGVIVAPHFEVKVQARTVEQQPAVPAPSSANGPEQMTPGLSTGSMGAYLFLAHHIQSDELVVNGIDMLKLQQGELDLLSAAGVNPVKIEHVINQARDTHLYQVAAPKSPAPVK